STDDTIDIVSSYSDPRLKIFRQPQNRGIANNFNFLVRAASAPYLKLLCSDDVLDSKAIELEQDFLDKYDSCVFVSCNRRVISSTGDPVATASWFHQAATLRYADVQLMFLLYGN